MSKPRVIVLAHVDKPIWSAAEYGEITFLFSPADKPIPHTSREFPLAIVRKLEQMSYDPANDYLLLVGSYVPLIAFAAVVTEQYDMPRALAFDLRQNSYYPLTLGIGVSDEIESNQLVPTATRPTQGIG